MCHWWIWFDLNLNQLPVWWYTSHFKKWLPLNRHYFVVLSTSVVFKMQFVFYYGTMWYEKILLQIYVSFISLPHTTHDWQWCYISETNIIIHIIHLKDDISPVTLFTLLWVFNGAEELSPTSWTKWNNSTQQI